MTIDNKCRILGIDPGLNNTGWGIIEVNGNRFSFIGTGILHSDKDKPMPARLAELYSGILNVIEEFSPTEVSIEETFVNDNPLSSLKLGQARGAVLVAPAVKNLPVFEYTPNQIKKMVVGTGHAEKKQVDMMVHTMLKELKGIKLGPDAADALAIALCHAYMRSSRLVKAQM